MFKTKLTNLLFVTLIFIGNSCIDENEPVAPVPQNWSSFEPLNIPFRQRRQQLEAGNIVYNGSFEEGKIFLDSALATFHLKGWKKVGDHIEWLNSEPFNQINGQFPDGAYAIRIKRAISSESEDQGEGVLSDFIKVIPGKYELTLQLKLYNISSNLQRLGTKIFDAIYIKLYFFDKNKLPIEKNNDYLINNNLIDNTYKGFPFSNFEKIDTIDWIKVKCRSHYNPLIDGYIPDNANYVKIFIGLKGTGEMWVDNVDYRYSKENFSFLEKFRPYFETNYSKYDLLSPTPKKVLPGDSIFCFQEDSTGKKYPVILVSPKAGKTTLFAARKLKQFLDSALNKPGNGANKNYTEVRIVNQMDNEIAENSSVVFSIGHTILYEMHKLGLPDDSILSKNSSYFIKQINDNPNTIYLSGNNETGNLYAVYTALQLFNDSGDVFLYAEIIDYPDFENRCIVMDETDCNLIEGTSNEIKIFTKYRFNNIYLNDNYTTEKWFLYDKTYGECLNKLNNMSAYFGFNYGVIINPYSHLPASQPVDSLNDEIRDLWKQSNNKSMLLLKNKILYASKNGASFLCLRTDNYLPYKGQMPNYCLYDKNDQLEFFNLAFAHISLINNLDKNITRQNFQVEFMPPWNNNYSIDLGKAYSEEYFRNIRNSIQANINFIWTGYNVKSHYIDEVDLYRYKNLTGKKPIYFDNYLSESNDPLKEGILSLYPGKILLSDIFNSENFNLPLNLNDITSGSKYILNFYPETNIDHIKLSVISEYLWNTATFNADSCIWKILVLNYGKKLAKELVYFNKYYTQLEELYYKSKIKKLDKKDEKDFVSINKQINNSLLRIRKYPEGPQLFDELIQLTDALVDKIPLSVN